MTQRSDATWGFMPQASAFSGALQQSACRFWDHQDKILDSMENFSNGWFERRGIGTNAASEAAQCMCKAQNPIDVANAYQDWFRGACQRIIADVFACQEQLVSLAGAFAAPSPGADRSSPEPHVRAIRSKAA